MRFLCANFSNNSIGVLVSFIERSSSIQLMFSPPIFKMPLYIDAGSKCMKGKWEIILLLHICWCPPKGICHAGNDIKMIPSELMYLGRFDKNVALSFICSITSWQMIKSNLCSNPFNLKISEAMKFPFICLSSKNRMASLILPADMSTPVVLLPVRQKVINYLRLRTLFLKYSFPFNLFVFWYVWW